jgi:phosphoribosylcarboxyaminoimidazole (NCAIR) mutase
MLGLASRSLTSFQVTVDESHTDADANAAPPILDATAVVPDAEAKCPIAANLIAAEPPGCIDAAPTEPAIGTPPLSATLA